MTDNYNQNGAQKDEHKSTDQKDHNDHNDKKGDEKMDNKDGANKKM